MLENILMSGANVSITLTANDLKEIINYTIASTRKEIEQVIIDDNSEVFMSPKQVSEMLGVDLSTLWRWNKRGYLIPLEVGGKRKYRKSDIKTKLLNSGKY